MEVVVEFDDELGKTGDYDKYGFKTQRTDDGEDEYIKVHVHRFSPTGIKLSKEDRISLAAMAVELYLKGLIPADIVTIEENATIIPVGNHWYPGIPNKPEFRDEYVKFELFSPVINSDYEGGDYNLLPQQENLLRKIVKEFQSEHGQYQQSFLVTRSMSGTSILWGDGPTFNYDRSTVWDDLEQIANEGLLSRSVSDRHKCRYQITQRSIDVVNSDFRIESKSTELTPASIHDIDFSFVNSIELRELIERDFRELQSLVVVDALKSILVLSGSIIEALLLDQLLTIEDTAKKSEKSPKGRKLEDWYLSDLVKVAVDLKVIEDETELYADELRHYRNVIHPGVEHRKEFEITRGRVEMALALLRRGARASCQAARSR